jgi:prepilin-type N-terminal cleavage/methylation domain-containing protein
VFLVMLIKKNQKGVTLFELMVTMILSGIMMTGAVLAYMQFMELWNSDASRLEVQRQGTYVLGVIEKAIRSGENYDLNNYENDKYHKITVTTLVVNKDTGVTTAKDKEFYLDKTTSPVTIVEKDSSLAQPSKICPDTYIEDGEVKSDFEVEDLSFTPIDAGGKWLSPVRIDLKLKKTNKVGETAVDEFFDFTVSVRLRNENVD